MHEMIAIKILKSYSPVIRSIAGQMNAKTPSKNNMEIFIQVGWVGLLDAMLFFDPEKGEFKNFAGRKIRGQIHDFQSGRDRLALGGRNRQTLLTETRKRSKQIKPESSSLIEIANKTQVGLDECRFVLSLIELCHPEGLDKVMLAMNCHTLNINQDRSVLVTAIKQLDSREKITADLPYEKKLSLQDTAQSQPSPEVKVLQHMIRDIKCLSVLEKKVLMLHHSKKVDNKDIPIMLGISGTRVRQIYQVAIKKLRARIPH